MTGKSAPGDDALAVAAAKGIAFFEKERPEPDPRGQAGKAEDGVSVAAGEAEYRAPRHPRNTNAPMAAIMPRTKRTMGAEPPRGLNSRVAMAAASEPSTSPMISGRRYWTMAARCRPSPPATSRSKHATQIPMFAGLPSFCSHTAISR